jgi:D-sedoheptulose 7-phosphate isomerase
MIVAMEPAHVARPRVDRALVAERIEHSNHTGEAFFAQNARAIAACAAAMADRFFAGGTLLVFGSGPHATDAQHNAVEYVHPVLPGCRALPSLSLTNDAATVTGMLQSEAALDVYAHQLRVLGSSGDIALGFAHAPLHPSIARALQAATNGGMLTVSLTSGDIEDSAECAEFAFHVPGTDSGTAHEIHLATYHMLWELVHIVLNHRGIGDGS